ncbi:hypothetical protein Tco_0703626 [Tanacetum coccineum]|uniref:Uncharacterized protein n=1 Tax=Tanacetum coccineum TaxID=301880 RepID=A0ABQ4XZD1_9ASTR
MMQVGTNPALARELLGADVNEDNFIERMTAIKERKKRALAELRYRALKGKPLKQSEVTKMMRNLVKNQWCAALIRRLEKDHLLSAQYNLFRPKPAITEPPSKRQRVERASSQPSDVSAATTQPADDPDSAGGSSFHPAGSTPMSGSAVPDTAGAPLDTTGTASTVPTSAAMDSAASRHELGISPFADSDNSSSPSPVSTDHIPIDVLFDSTSGGLHEFFLASDEDAPIGMSRIAADPASEDEVLAEILFRGQYVSGAGVACVVDKLPDDEIVDPRVKVEPISESASSPPRSRSKHRGVRSDTSLWDRPVDDFLSSESESDDDIEDYIPPIPYGALKIGRLILEETQDDWLVSTWKLYPKSSVHVLDLTHGKTVYMFVDKVYPIRAPLLERMLHHRLTVPPSYCRDVVVAGSVIQTIQDGLRESMKVDMVINPPWNLPFLGAKGLTSPEQTATGKGISNPLMAVMVCPKPYGIQLTNVSIWKLLLRDVAASFDSAVHRDHAGSFDAVVPSLVSAACVAAAAYLVPAALQSSCLKKIYLETWN